MRYAASEKLEIIKLVEGSHLPVKQTLEMLGVSRPTFYRVIGGAILVHGSGDIVSSRAA